MAAVHGHHSPTPLQGGLLLRPTSPSDRTYQQDRKDLERFSKFFTMKAVQVIVHSRLGEKIKCPSRASSTGADWFNLAIEDNAEILKQTKLAIGNNSLPTPPLVVEISLETIDGKKLTLEIWKLSFTDETEENIRILYTVYNRMSLLLKSLITVTRVLPAYKLSRVKGDYVMEYNVYTMDSNENIDYASKLGRECRSSLLGSVVTPFGSICIEFAYRTKMEMSFGQSPVVVKEDHYSMDSTLNKSQTDQLVGASPQPNPNPIKIPAFSDPLPPTPNNSNSSLNDTSFAGDEVPFSNLLKKSLLNSSRFSPGAASRKPEITSSDSDHNNSTSTIPELDSSRQQQQSSAHTGSDGSQEFEFLEVKPLPFAPEVSDTSSDPAAFFTSLQNPPVLDSLEGPTTHDDIDKQLHTFEENLPIFDDFVNKLCS